MITDIFTDQQIAALKRAACEWVLAEHPYLYDDTKTDAMSACKIDAALHPHRKRFILTADGWQYAIRYRKLSSPFRFCYDALPLQPQYQRQVEEALC